MAETFLSLATGLGLSTAAGFNAYLPLLITGILARTTDLSRWTRRSTAWRNRSCSAPSRRSA